MDTAYPVCGDYWRRRDQPSWYGRWEHKLFLLVSHHAWMHRVWWGFSCHMMQATPYLVDDGAVHVGSDEHVTAGDDAVHADRGVHGAIGNEVVHGIAKS